MNFDIFSLNSFGIGNAGKLLAILEQCMKLKTSDYFFLCIQETKIVNIKKSQKDMLDRFGLTFHLVPAIAKSGGLLTIWHQSLTPSYQAFEGPFSLTLFFPSLDISLCNIYINQTQQMLKMNSITSILQPFLDSTLFLIGDFNAFPFHQTYTTSTLRPGDPRITAYTALSTVLEKFHLTDTATTPDYTHFDRRSQSFAKLDYIFSNSNEEFNSQVHITSLSDHMLLQLLLMSVVQATGN